MFWTIRSFPELQHLDEPTRSLLIRKCVPRRVMFRIWGNAICMGTVIAFVLRAALSAALSLALDGWVTVGPWPLAVLIPLGIGLVYAYHLVHIRGEMRIYLENARRRGPLPLCLNCGYSTTGLSSPVCPECGASIPPPAMTP